MERDKSDFLEQLTNLLVKDPPDMIFLDEGVCLRPKNPIWGERKLKLVVAVEPWKGKPPIQWWTCETRQFMHQDVGGVTNGIFDVHLAIGLSFVGTIPTARVPTYCSSKIQAYSGSDWARYTLCDTESQGGSVRAGRRQTLTLGSAIL